MFTVGVILDLTVFLSLSPDDQPLGRLPPRCGRQRRLQEHLLRHHPRRGQGGGIETPISLSL